MKWARPIVRELWGLFVDDGAFALAIVIWLAIAWLILPTFMPASSWAGVALFLGLALVLADSIWR
jgi:hypothetical protein